MFSKDIFTVDINKAGSETAANLGDFMSFFRTLLESKQK